ncbi:MAG: beta-galactosidase [Anaerolineales bacterium]|nr:beta-galactosidase [Anaerolineales bacterium]
MAFGWAKLEPKPSQYQFDWLDRILDLLHANGVQVALAAATASPPHLVFASAILKIGPWLWMRLPTIRVASNLLPEQRGLPRSILQIGR